MSVVSSRFKLHRRFNGRQTREISGHHRLWVLAAMIIFLIVVIIARLFILQIIDVQVYRELAFGGRALFSQLQPKRGEIFMYSKAEQKQVPLVLNEDRFLVYADGRYVKDPFSSGTALAEALHISEEEKVVLLNEMSVMGNDPYVPLFKSISEFDADVVRELHIAGIGLIRNSNRFYPEGSRTAHVSGFFSVANDERVGQYGLEGFFNELLAGSRGSISGERDPLGSWIPLSERDFKAAVHGADVVTTIDPAIQTFACDVLLADARTYEVRSASLIIMDPKTGEILAMCNTPGFDPNRYAEVVDIDYFNNNAIFSPYEPGSVFKPVVMAAAIDQGKVTPQTTFVDQGYEVVDDFTIRNAGNKVFGLSTMTKVLVDSINTGMIFAARTIGHEVLAGYVERFGFGKLTGIELDTEITGTIDNIYKKGGVFLATASFGQGITATPLQLIAAYGALANQGKLLQPTIVKTIRYADGREVHHHPIELRQVVSPRTAAQISAMLVSVIRDGHSKAADVKGYLVAGKTGTAQIAGDDGGYGEEFNHTFIGFAPADDARFVVLIKFERPNQAFAANTTTGTFGKIASFLVKYLRITPDY